MLVALPVGNGPLNEKSACEIQIQNHEMATMIKSCFNMDMKYIPKLLLDIFLTYTVVLELCTCKFVQLFILNFVLVLAGNVTLLNKYLSSIQTVNDYIRILETNSLRTLSFLNNLQLIRGERLHDLK